MSRTIRTVSVIACCWSASLSVSLGEVAQEWPRDFVQALALKEVAAGIVVPEEMFKRRVPSGADETTAGRTTLDSVDSRMESFNFASGPFRAARKGRVIHVRSLDEPQEVTRALERAVEVRESVELPALQAVYSTVVGAISGAEPSGIVGSGILPGSECPLGRAVKIRPGSLTAIALLDEIVLQTPGLVWLATYDRDLPHANLKVGLMCPDGSTRKINVFP